MELPKGHSGIFLFIYFFALPPNNICFSSDSQRETELYDYTEACII